MQTISLPSEMRAGSRRAREAGRKIGFVPTMGSLHEGHLSLIREARRLSEWTVVSIFVNPAQFGPTEDLDAYPRYLAADLELCRRESVDAVFHPPEDAMYAAGCSTQVEETTLSRGMCGVSRPGHFRGVTTVVAKLFNIVEPDVAVFGRKDAQQARVIERMVRDLNFPVRIVIAPIVRESDGLAMSSRNRYLSREERRQALCLREALNLAEELAARGETAASFIEAEMRKLIEARPSARVDYIGIVDFDTLEPVERVKEGTLLALAVWIGGTRLIDNTVIER